ncbi:hypothetical protein [Burkholderia multivorans]|uniref:hypothetical protein n=1 Tax=Burkholderia multivorans TaxID=87883 RepID=UPI0013E04845|nr:hypothetical protein [Burkholderia multivorans]MDR9048866.1 hypothetical protein [Burkholderia multivorans]MDR9059317.1 hypothetical protein [Burkholderia multivorans]MDR9064579.1 hypothetical protein [Burkholderia multivorans]MDR9067394.1 hypothetical protein [Burkholderia multivorans]MDR9073480.1 hypothetical protein [Burkholderia multivorans]
MSAINHALRGELRAAHLIIRAALSVLTFDQKIAWSNANERDGVNGEGITRADERQAAIDGADAHRMYRELKYADRIIANANAILSGHQRELWALEIQRAAVALSHPTCDDVRRWLLARGEPLARELGAIADPTGDRTVCVIKPLRAPSEADLATLRRLLATDRSNRATMLRDVPPGSTVGISAAARDVLAERRRQIDVEGYTSRADDENRAGAMSSAAAAYALIGSGWSQAAALEFWPEAWSGECWKPADSRRNLVKAAALLLAEIERIDRQATRAKPEASIPQPAMRG